MKQSKSKCQRIVKLVSVCIFLQFSILMLDTYGYYTTKGKDVVDKKTGEKVFLKGFGLGGWLLPEGYMWGLRKLDRPRQFEAAILDLIGEQDAKEFWRLYHDNFVTESDVKAMKSWGVNSVRIALLASRLQPREGQPEKPPYNYSEEGFKYLDNIVRWCNKYKVGLIWDMHGAPGAQNAANISDSDGQARLWTEKEKYWPRCIELWYKIAERYKDEECIIGYDFLNEPLLRRYEGIDVGLLRQLYVELTKAIRKVDKDGIIFIEGDDWAQNFDMLEPIDWDEHLVIAFHSYPPTSNEGTLERWEKLRQKYNVPLWHGETGEQGPPYIYVMVSTEFLQKADVGWNWWTHKKFDLVRQPWNCPKTEGFQKIIDYWKGKGKKPTREDAKKWLFEQARKSRSEYCEFLDDMVRSLIGLDPDGYIEARGLFAPEILKELKDVELEAGYSASLYITVRGHPLSYQWYKNGKILADENSIRLKIPPVSIGDDGARYSVTVSNEKGSAKSKEAVLTVKPYSSPVISKTTAKIKIDGNIDDAWNDAKTMLINKLALGKRDSQNDLSGSFKVLWDQQNLYLLVEVTDDLKLHNSDQGYENDGIEVYMDYDNSKSDFYEENDFRFRYVWSEEKLRANFGQLGPGIKGAQKDTQDGYIMEIAFAWNDLGGKPREGKFIGIDVHVNDSDGHSREGKITWKAKRDRSYRSPSYLGALKLSSNDGN